MILDIYIDKIHYKGIPIEVMEEVCKIDNKIRKDKEILQEDLKHAMILLENGSSIIKAMYKIIYNKEL